MNNFEKIVLMEMCNKQFTKFPNKEYYDTLEKLSESEKIKFHNLSNEIHDIWNKINGVSPDGSHLNVNSMEEYDEKINPISKIILQVSKDFEITLKDEPSEKYRETIIRLFGKGYLDELLEK